MVFFCAKIAQATSYREQQSANERARLDALADLDNQISLARLNGSANLNELEAQYAQLLNEQANLDREFNYQRERDTIAQDNFQKEFDAAQAQVEWEQRFYEQQFKSEEAQRKLDNAYAAASIGDFSKLEELKINTANAKHLYELEQETMYRSVYGDDTVASPDADVPEQYKALQEKDAEAYETVVEYARSFAENQYGRDEQELTEYMHDMVNWVRRQYGEEYAKLYREVINANFAALDQQVYEQNTAAYGTFDLDAFIANAQQIVYGDVVKTKEDGLGNTQKTTSREVVDPVARENYLLELMVAYQTPYSQMTDAEFRRGYQALGYTEKEVRELMKAQEEQGE